MRIDLLQYLILMAFACETGETVGAISDTGYRIVACMSQFAGILQNTGRKHGFNIPNAGIQLRQP